MESRGFPVFIISILAMLPCAGALAQSPQTDESMLELIRQQQAQLEAQSRTIAELQKKVDALSTKVEAGTSLESDSETGREMADAGPAAEPTAKPTAKPTTGATREVSNSLSLGQASLPYKVTENKLSFTPYGWVNQAGMYTDDGDSSDFWVVDGTISSWIGAVGAYGINDEWSVGFHLEYDYLRNYSGSVSQLENAEIGAGDGFRDRFRQIGLRSERLGTLILGKGSTASDETSHMLLSGTLFTGQHTQIADMAGAMLFYDNAANELSDVNVASVINSYDGLGRQTKVRYDSPRLWDRFIVSGSVVTDDGGDIAVRYNDKWGDDWTVAAAAGLADPDSVDQEGEDRYSGSFGILHSSGWNFNASFSGQDFDDSARDEAEFGYLLLGYRNKIFDFGETRFGLEYAWNDNRFQDDDEAEVWGFAISQAIPAAQSEVYLITRLHELDRPGRDFEDLWVTHIGWRLYFRDPISLTPK